MPPSPDLEPYCSRCGASLPQGQTAAGCPRCLFESALDRDVSHHTAGSLRFDDLEDSPLPAEPTRWVGDYEILDVIARGGVGVVYRARHKTLKRFAAVKMLVEGPHATEEFKLRFRREAESAAKLQHPNIVQVFESGIHDKEPFFAMEYVEGITFSEVVREHPLDPRMAASYLISIADAIQHAHERGIIHRDLKPSNVILDLRNRPRVTDFGLAKQATTPLDGELTLTGQTLGSPNYLPPEQISTRHGIADARSDIYSMGALLYHLLTGRPPFLSSSLMETLKAVQEEDILPPKALVPTIPDDLQTICLTCLNRIPKDRYASAQALKEDLERFLNYEPIKAQPAGRLKSAVRWCQRRPLIASLLALSLASLVGGVMTTTWYVSELRDTRSGWQSQVADLQLQKAEGLFANGKSQQANECLIQLLGSNPHNEIGTQRLLSSLMHANRAHLVWRSPRTFRGTLQSLSRDSTRLLVHSGEGWAQIWDAATGHPLSPRLKTGGDLRAGLLADSGDRAATFSADGLVRLWDIKTGRELTSLRHTNGLTSGALSPDGLWLACADSTGNTLIWRPQSGALPVTHLKHTAGIRALEFSPDSQHILALTEDDTIQVWPTQGGEPTTPPLRPDNKVESAHFSPKGDVIATAGKDAVRLWPVTTGSGLPTTLWNGEGARRATFRQDGRYLLGLGFDGTARVWGVGSGQPGSSTFLHKHRVTAGGFLGDTPLVFTGCEDGSAQIWDLEMSSPVTEGFGTGAGIISGLGLGNGQAVVLGDADGNIHLWRFEREPPGIHTRNTRSEIQRANGAASADLLITTQGEGSVSLWKGSTLESIGSLPGNTPICGTAFSKDGTLLATFLSNNTIRVWNLQTRQEKPTSWQTPNRPCAGAFDSGGARLLVGDVSGAVHVFNLRTGDKIASSFTPANGARCAAAGLKALRNPDEFLIALEDGTFGRWNLSSNRWTAGSWIAPSGILCIDVNPDESLVGVACVDGRCHLSPLQPGEVGGAVLQHEGKVNWISFSPNEARVVTASSDNTVRVWDTASGFPLSAPLHFPGEVVYASFNADGNRVLAAISCAKTNGYLSEIVWAAKPPAMPEWFLVWAEQALMPNAGPRSNSLPEIATQDAATHYYKPLIKLWNR